jgi:hypothetical protein
MNKLIAGLALALAVGASGSSAQAGPWCAFYGPSTYNCGFQTYQQCYATVLGAGGWCRQNFFEPTPAPSRAAARRASAALERRPASAGESPQLERPPPSSPQRASGSSSLPLARFRHRRSRA